MELTSFVSLSQLKKARAKARRHDSITVHDEVVDGLRIRVYVEGGRGYKTNMVSISKDGISISWDFIVEAEITNKEAFTLKIENIVNDMIGSAQWKLMNQRYGE